MSRDSSSEPRRKRSLWTFLPAVVIALSCLGCFGFLSGGGFTGLPGTDKDEDDYSPREQRRLLDTFSPVPVPPSATGLRIRYQGFQDWHMDISFTLPPGDFEAYVAQLTPHEQEPGAYAGRTRLGDGGFVADASAIRVDPAARRVKITAFTF